MAFTTTEGNNRVARDYEKGILNSSSKSETIVPEGTICIIALC